jgi:hypothetical protein
VSEIFPPAAGCALLAGALADGALLEGALADGALLDGVVFAAVLLELHAVTVRVTTATAPISRLQRRIRLVLDVLIARLPSVPLCPSAGLCVADWPVPQGVQGKGRDLKHFVVAWGCSPRTAPTGRTRRGTGSAVRPADG